MSVALVAIFIFFCINKELAVSRRTLNCTVFLAVQSVLLKFLYVSQTVTEIRALILCNVTFISSCDILDVLEVLEHLEERDM